MKKIIVGIAAGAMFLAPGLAYAGPSEYLDNLRERPSISGSDEYLLKIGYGICDFKRQGHEPLDIAEAMVKADVVDDYGDAGWWVGSALVGLCPETVDA